MTQLLVSVRSPEEAEAALSGGADIIDIKEPSRGSLGRADDGAIAAIVRQVAGRRPVSVAMGELMTWRAGSVSDRRSSHPPVAYAPGSPEFVKTGLSGCAAAPGWEARLCDLALICRPSQFVPVAYADAERAQSPTVAQVLRFAIDLASPVLLIDTWKKDGRTLLDWLPVQRLVELRDTCRKADLRLALAGSLGISQIDEVLALDPDIIAVRGAACRGGERQAEIDNDAVLRLAQLVHGRSRKLTRMISVEDSAAASCGNHLSTMPAAANSSQVL